MVGIGSTPDDVALRSVGVAEQPGAAAEVKHVLRRRATQGQVEVPVN
jgi:hypothetical protein